jgi:hypothetical protein
MEQTTGPTPDDLTGIVDDRRSQFENLPADGLSADWLRRQLDNALTAWAATATELDIEKEKHADY